MNKFNELIKLNDITTDICKEYFEKNKFNCWDVYNKAEHFKECEIDEELPKILLKEFDNANCCIRGLSYSKKDITIKIYPFASNCIFVGETDNSLNYYKLKPKMYNKIDDVLEFLRNY